MGRRGHSPRCSSGGGDGGQAPRNPLPPPHYILQVSGSKVVLSARKRMISYTWAAVERAQCSTPILHNATAVGEEGAALQICPGHWTNLSQYYLNPSILCPWRKASKSLMKLSIHQADTSFCGRQFHIFAALTAKNTLYNFRLNLLYANLKLCSHSFVRDLKINRDLKLPSLQSLLIHL